MKTISLVLCGVVKATAPGDKPFYALVQKHFSSGVYIKEFWQGVAIDTAANRCRRFETLADAAEEMQLFTRHSVRVDAIIRVDLKGQHVEWSRDNQEAPPQDPDAGSW